MEEYKPINEELDEYLEEVLLEGRWMDDILEDKSKLNKRYDLKD